MEYQFEMVGKIGSMALIRKFADLSIEKLQDKGPAGHTVDVSSLPVSGETPDSILLTNLLHEEQVKTEGIAVGAKQAGIPINRRTDTRSDIERMLWKELNPEALYLYTAKDLIILELGSFPNRGGTTELGYTYTILPFNRITDFTRQGDSDPGFIFCFRLMIHDKGMIGILWTCLDHFLEFLCFSDSILLFHKL